MNKYDICIDMGDKFITKQDKEMVSRSNGRFTYIVFRPDHTIYTSTRNLLSHAWEDVQEVDGEAWLNGSRSIQRPSEYETFEKRQSKVGE